MNQSENHVHVYYFNNSSQFDIILGQKALINLSFARDRNAMVAISCIIARDNVTTTTNQNILKVKKISMSKYYSTSQRKANN